MRDEPAGADQALAVQGGHQLPQLGVAAIGASGIPMLYVQSGADLVLADLDRLAKLVPQATLGRVVGSATTSCRPPPPNRWR